MSRPPDHSQPALPGLQPAKRLYAASWSTEARRFADSLIDAWNAAFKSHGVHAYHVRHNHFAAVQLYRFLDGPANDGDPKMTTEDCRLAIRLYSEDPHNLKHCHGRFQRFADWLAGCPDNVDKQLARVGRRRGAQAMTSDQTAARQLAEELLTARPWYLGDVARRATDSNVPLREFVTDILADVTARPRSDRVGLREWLQPVADLLRDWDSSLTQQVESSPSFILHDPPVKTRARILAAAMGARLPIRSVADRNLWAALTLALFARERNHPTMKPEDARP